MGDYRVEFIAPADTELSPADQGGNDATDSDAGPNGRSPIVTLTGADPVDDTVDAGITPLGTIGDTVWRDDDNDGIQDPGEPGYPGVTVNLLDGDGNPVLDDNGDPITTTTGPGGEYEFTDLPLGDYRVEFIAPADTELSPADQGGNDATDSDAGPNGRSPIVTLTGADPVDNTVDAGITPLGTIGDTVWRDDNNDGIQDPGEPGYPGVTVNLLDGAGNAVDTTTTGPNGTYEFADLPLGDYRVEFIAPADTELSPADQGGNDATDSDAGPNGRSPIVTLTGADPVDNTVDAGITPLGTIGDTVWRDDNNDGIQDPGEPGYPGVTVNLLDGDGNPVLDDNGDPITTTTGPNGGYSFADLPLGDYRIEFIAPADTVISPAGAGGDPANDSDPGANGRTPVITLTGANPVDNTVDAGLTPLGTIGDTVWRDDNNDGIQDAGEPGYPGVVVNLLDGDGNPVLDDNGDPITTTTGPNGGYSFADLPLGDYRVEFIAPADTVISPAGAGGDPANDSDPGANGRTPVITLTGANPLDNTVDAGITPLGTIGDKVWRDDDNDGIQDAGEPGYPGVTVNLLDAAGNPVVDDNGDPITTTTGPNGGYSFADLPLGDYRVEFIAPADTELSPADQGGNDATDSDAGPNGRSPVVTLTGAEPVDNTVDAGITPLGTIGDTVWRDDNNDGIQDAGEPGYPGVVVNLLDGDGNPVLDDNGDPITTTTGPNGGYEFTDLPLGDYRIEFIAPADTELSPADAGGNDATDSDPGPNGRSPIVTLTGADPADNTIDAGITPLGTIGDTVWRDDNNDGIQDPGEPGYPGVTVNLLDGDGNPVLDDNGDPITTTTGPNGGYSFADLPLGDYRIEFIAPADTVISPAGAGGDPANDSDPGANGRTPVITLTGANPVDNTVDAGLTPLGTIGDTVWRDDNNDGIQDPGEPGYPGVTVNLLDGDGNPVLDDNGDPITTTTGPNGGYSFADLPLGDYRIEFIAPADTVISPAGAGGDPANDSDPGANGRTPVITLTGANPVDNTVDAGLTPLGTIGDTVWRDDNNDGIQDPGEPGYPGVTVNLLDAAGNPVLDDNGDPITTTTGPNGGYSFADLPLGDYRIEIEAPDQTVISPDGEGADPSVDSDADPATGRSPVVSLTGAAPVDDTVDAGLTPLGTIGDTVWRDDNNDGIQDAGEPGYPGVVVNLLDGDGNPVLDDNGDPITTTTGPNGGYEFTDLPLGDYRIEIEAPDDTVISPAGAGGDPANDSDPGANGRTPVITLTGPNPVDNTVDAGLTPLGTIGDKVWNDSDGDGIQDAGEPGVPGVTVILRDANGNEVTRTTTDEGGSYRFERLPLGDYTVEFTGLPNGMGFTMRGAGDDAVDSDPGHNGRTGTVTLTPTDRVTRDVDAGIVPLGSIGDKVWNDANRDGLQTSGEPGIPGVTVTLYAANGSVVATSTTDANGSYLFTGLALGDYTVGFSGLPPGATFTQANAGGDDTVDSDAGPGGRTGTISLTVGTPDNRTVDAGLLERLGSIGSRVWRDTDGNGIQDPGEPGVAGITVKLLDANGNVLATTTTDANGTYLFAGLPLGTYILEFSNLPPGMKFTDLKAGGSDENDSDVGPDGRTRPITLTLERPDVRSVAAGIVKAEAPRTKTKPKLKTRASAETVTMQVSADGSVSPAKLFDTVTVKGFTRGGDATGTATLYGPVDHVSKSACESANKVDSVNFKVRSGTIRTPKVKVTEPGFYTWTVKTSSDKLNEAASHRCGLAAESTLVKRAGYGPIRIPTGPDTTRPEAAADGAPRVGIPALGIDASVRTVRARKGTMGIPGDIARLGWLNRSAGLGEVIGTSVVAGHVSDHHDSPGSFWRLRKAHKGQIVTVREGGETLRYRVTSVRTYLRSKALPREMFRTSGKHQLALVSCTGRVTYPNGSFHYTRNVVVIASPLS